MSKEFDYSAFTSKFVEEARDHLNELNNYLLTLETDPTDEKAMGSILREVHTLKGSARMIKAEDIGEIAHKIEDVLIGVRDKKLKLDKNLTDLIFTSFDSIELLLHTLTGDQEKAIDVKALCEKLAAARGKPEAKPEVEPETRPKATEKIRKETKLAPKETKVLKEKTLRVSASKLDQLVNLAGEMVINQTRLKEREKELKDLMVNLRMQSRHWRVLQAKLEQLKTSKVLHSDIDLVDKEQAQIEEATRRLIRKWREDTTQMGTIITNVQGEIFEARMVPISTLFDTFHRLVRDLSVQFGKEIDLVIKGGDTELDKKMIEVINDPLIHLVRNAIDHGIEKPEEREKRGKNRRGTVLLSARQEGDNVVIEVSDDGTGIDPEEVKKAAVERKLIDEREAKEMEDRQVIELLFRSGFSTRSQVTDISGRGIGMDVVKKNVEELKGMIDFKSELGKGTTVILEVPLTMAVIRVLLVKLGEHCFAIPTTTVEETLRIDAERIKTVEKKEVIILREHPLPLARLGQILRLGEKREVKEGERTAIVVINFAGIRIGFVVDDLVGEQQVVIKTLGSYLKKIENVAGATILGSGDVVIILNVPDLTNAARGISYQPVELVPKVEERPSRILVVEDALTTRELEKHILEVASYEVDVAIDGLDALEKVRRKDYDLLVVDVQMPRLDGFELTKRLKKDKRYRDVPIVIVTTMEKEEDKRKGIEVGADAYIVKSAFNQASFLDTIERLI